MLRAAAVVLFAASVAAGTIRLRDETVTTAGAARSLEALPAALTGKHQLLFTFEDVAVVPRALRQRLAEQVEAEHLQYLPDNTFLAFVDVAKARAVARTMAVSVTLFEPRFKGIAEVPGDAEVLRASLYPANRGADLDLAKTVAHVAANVAKVPVEVVSADMLVVRIPYAADARSIAAALAELPEVNFVDKHPEFVTFNKFAKEVCLSEQSVNFASAGLNGEGEIIGVADTGLDQGSCFFKDSDRDMPFYPDVDYEHRKVVSYIAMPGADRVDQAGGHGSHVAGSAAGSVEDSDSDRAPYSSAASKAKIVFQDVGNSRGLLSGIPSDLYGSGFFTVGRDIGNRLHTNSWGNPCTNLFGGCPGGVCGANSYSPDSQSVDRFSFDNLDTLILFAAGNDGGSPCSPQDQTFNTVSSPSNAKNALTVGASSTSDDGWDEYCVRNFGPTGGQYQQCLVEHPQTQEWMSYFSSRGPTADRRIKPDVSAPGHGIYSARAIPNNPDTCEVLHMSGTSMATPFTAGVAAVVRQYFTQGYHPGVGPFVPSAALVKAVLINTGGEMSGNVIVRGNTRSLDRSPSNFYGFGLVRVPPSMSPDGDTTDDKRRVWINTQCGGADRYFLDAGETHTYSVEVEDPSVPLQVTLVWTDPASAVQAASNLVNNLDLRVTNPANQIRLGNDVYNQRYNLPSPDVINNVEEISYIDGEVSAGTYTIEVDSVALNFGDRQTYALVVSGGIVVPDAPTVKDLGDSTGINVLSGDLEGAEGATALDAPCFPNTRPQRWYQWTAPATATYSFEVTSADFEARVAVYSVSDDATSNTCTGDILGCGDSASAFVEEGETVRVIVASPSGDMGSFSLSVFARSCTDDEVASDIGSATGDSVVSMMLSGDADPANAFAFPCGDVMPTSGPQAHYLWTAPRDGFFSFVVDGDADPVTTVYFPEVGAEAQCVTSEAGCGEAVNGVELSAGTTLRIVVAAMGPGPFTLSIFERAFCADATDMPVIIDIGSETGANLVEDEDDDDDDDGSTFSTHWIDFEADAAGFYTVTLASPLSSIAIYEGPESLQDGEACVGALLEDGVGSINNLFLEEGARLRIATTSFPEGFSIWFTCSSSAPGTLFAGSTPEVFIPLESTASGAVDSSCGGAANSAVVQWETPAEGYFWIFATSDDVALSVSTVDGEPCEYSELECGEAGEPIAELWAEAGTVLRIVASTSEPASFAISVFKFCKRAPVDVTFAGNTLGGVAMAPPVSSEAVLPCGDSDETAQAAFAWQSPLSQFYAISASDRSLRIVSSPVDDCEDEQLACDDDVILWARGDQQLLISAYGDGEDNIALDVSPTCAPEARDLGSDTGSSIWVSATAWISGFEPSVFFDSDEAGDAQYLSVGEWTAPSDGSYTFSVDAGFDAAIGIFASGSSCEQLAFVPRSVVVVELAEGQTVLVAVGGGEGTFSLGVSDLCLDPNFDIGSRTGQSVLSGTTVGLPRPPLAPGCGGSSGSGPAAVILWEAPATGSYSFLTEGSGYDTVLAVFSASECERIECNDDVGRRELTSRIDFDDVPEGTQLFFFVAGYSGASGPFVFSVLTDVVIEPTQSPEPDQDCNTPDFDVGSGIGADIVSGTTSDRREGVVSFDCGSVPADASTVVVRWVAPQTDDYTIDLAGSDYDTVLTVVNPAQCASAVGGCNDDANGNEDGGPQVPRLTSRLDFSFEEGAEVLFAISGYNGETGTFTMSIFPANVAATASISPLPACRTPDENLGSQTGVNLLQGTNVGAREGVASFECGGTASAGPTYLVKWTAPEGGVYKVTTEGSTLDTVVSLLLPDGCRSIGCADDAGLFRLHSEVFLLVDEDVEVVIAIAGYNGATGNFVLSILAQEFSVEAESCGGRTTFTLEDFRPNTNYLLAASRVADDNAVIPSGPCAGTSIGLGLNAIIGTRTLTTNGNGDAVFSVNNFDLCGRYVQVVDLEICTVSDVIEIEA